MFLRKQSWKDFSNYIKAAKIETALLKETNKFLKNATNLNPLMKWYKRKFWTVSPKGLLIEAEIKQINIQIDGDGVQIQGYGSDGVIYDELAFFDKESATDMAQLVAGTYIKQLEEDKKFYKDMLDKTDEAIAYAKLPPEDKKDAVLPGLSPQAATSGLCQTVPIEPVDMGELTTSVTELNSTLLPKTTNKGGTKQKNKLRPKAQ